MTNTEKYQFDDQLNVIPFLLEGEFYFSLGVKAFRKHEFEKAEKWLKRAIELEPDNPLYPSQLSVLYTEIKAYDQANQMLTKVLEDFGDSYVDCYYLIANNYAHLGLFQDAKKNIETYLQNAPHGEFANEAKELLNLLKIYNDDLEEDGDEWIFDEEDELLTYQESAFYYLEHQDWDQALPILEHMIARYPDYVVAQHDFAWALFFSGEYKRALEIEKEAYEENPNSIHSIVNLAIFYAEMGEQEQSNQYIEWLENVYPIHDQQRLKIAAAFAHTKHYKLAYERFKHLPKNNLQNHLSYYKWYSIVLYKVEMYSKAVEIWKEGCSRHPYLKEIGKQLSIDVDE
ncbi:Tetratricopeptide repeat-containing protein [Salinibacillus kushneri]|uniref:Tetratricopeptide repeat-containing protein n=1 Tax=Salinibacillus kushneri TaxID=237682 RepID=A0A1H9YLQ7_9BACI|nr:tetratricopeptide repeat protein [Salinibacillus kushneri]SES70059.1 Tetratricopeptide repeat-containing protein [Salinibacillus kushneri]